MMIDVNRRFFGASVAAFGAASAAGAASAKTKSKPLQGEGYSFGPMGEAPRPTVAMLMYPGLTALDLIGPHTALAPACDIHLVWKNKDLMVSDTGLVTRADTTFAECPKQVDVLFVPGGPGGVAVLEDPETLRFLADRGARAKYVTSVCTGSLMLGGAGLLQGYRAGSHWAALALLPTFGAIPVEDRVVVDRNRVTAGGVTAGLDFGLQLLAILISEETAKVSQVAMQYDPKPPYDVGTPAKAGQELAGKALAWMGPVGLRMAEAAEKASKIMGPYKSA